MLTKEQIQAVDAAKDLHGRLVKLYEKSDAERKLLLALHKTLEIITSLIASSDEDYKRGYAAGNAAKRKAPDKAETPTEGGDNAEAQPLD